MPRLIRLVQQVAAIAVILAGTQLVSAQKKGDPAIYPNAKMTPGKINPDITQANLTSTVCSKDWTGINKFTGKPAKGTDVVRPPVSVTDKIKTRTMKAYGFTGAASQYELDHFISLELGGCPDCVANLWPEAYGDAKHPMTVVERAAFERDHPGETTILPGSSQKDKVEDHLKSEMCKGKITLAQAQKIISTDWYACYLDITASPARDCK